MSILSGLFRSRDKPTNSTNGSTYRFLFGGSNSGKAVNERSAMQMTAVYPLRQNSFRVYCWPAGSCLSIHRLRQQGKGYQASAVSPDTR